VPTFVDRGVSRGQRGGSPTVVNLSFLDRIFKVTGIGNLVLFLRSVLRLLDSANVVPSSRILVTLKMKAKRSPRKVGSYKSRTV
jgi:hypothetical protein